MPDMMIDSGQFGVSPSNSQRILPAAPTTSRWYARRGTNRVHGLILFIAGSASIRTMIDEIKTALWMIVVSASGSVGGVIA